MPFALADAATQALRRLRKLGLAETPAAADTSVAAEIAAALFAECNARRLFDVADSGAIPDVYRDPFVDLLAEQMRPTFVGDAVNQDVRNDALGRLVDATRLDRSGTPDATLVMVRRILQRVRIDNSEALQVIDAQFVTDELPSILSDLAASTGPYAADVDNMDPSMQTEFINYATACLLNNPQRKAASWRAMKVLMARAQPYDGLTLEDPDGSWSSTGGVGIGTGYY